MDNSSSSASALEEASMDDSEQEHEYDYDIDDADDDPHDDYDDIPEEDDEEEEEDDMDDQIQALPNDIATLTDIISDRLMSHRSDHVVHAIPFRTIRSGNEGFHFDNFVSVGGPFLVPGGRDDSLRSLFMDTFEALGAGGDSPRFLSSMEPVRLDMSNFLPMPSRSHPVSMLTTRLSRHTDPPPAIHPHLAPPRPSVSSPSVDLLSTIARRTPHLASLFDRAVALPGSSSPACIRALDALHRLSTVSDQGDVPSSSRLPLDYIPSSVPRTSDGLPLHHLLDADLMRTAAIAPRSEGPLIAFARGRAALDRIPPRESERSRDKVPSSITRRWRYEPFLSGGDMLPSIFDADASRRSARSDLRSDTVSSNPQPEVPKYIAHTASKVVSTIESMLVDLGNINENLRAAEKRVEEEKKRLEELKKKEAESALKALENNLTQASADIEGDDKPKMSDDDANVSQTPGTELSAAASLQPEATQNPQQPDSIVAESTENAVNADSSNPQHDDTGSSLQHESEPGHEMGDSSDGAMETEDAGNTPAVDRPTSDDFTPEVVDSEQPAQTTNGQFSAIATQRAAAAGISLDAPANENPEVVAAATQSTGIDPAFLAALPEDMRTEILTENYERIRTSVVAQDGTSSSSPATTVNQDFLIALPPALRAEVLELDAEFQARREAQSSPTAEGNGAPTQGEVPVAASEMDTATFLATLPPDLREEILLTSGESVIQSLPPNVAAEARVLREREMSSRLPWRVGRSDAGNPFTNGPDNRDFGSGRLGSGSGRRGDRSAPREAPVYKWKKVPDGWLREQPNPANEPPASMQPNGLSALVNLLSVGTGSTGKNWNILYQVFSHVCKTTELRYVILDEIIGLITNNPDVSPASSLKGPEIEKDRSRFHGTAVRRGLDLLLMLCKNDVLVSETLLGLPKNEKELKHVGEHPIEEEEDGFRPVESNLSTLISLLKNRLFERSTSHLEQLIAVISVVSQAVPPRDVNSPEKLRNRRTSSRTRSFFERHGFSRVIGSDPWNVLYSQLEADDHGMYDPGDDDAEDVRDVDDSFTRAVLRARAPSDGPLPNNDDNAEKDEKEKEKKIKEIVPIRFRVPALRQTDLEALAKVLLRTGCSEKTYDRVSRTIGLLGELPSNRVVFMRTLVSIAMDAGTKILKEYENLLNNLRSGKLKTGADSIFSLGNATNEITLLRVVKSLTTLMRHNTNQANVTEMSSTDDGKEDRNSGKSEAHQARELAEKPFRSNVVHGLSGMWAVLDQLLECVADEVKGKEKKESSISDSRRPSTIAAAAILNGERLKVGTAGLSPTLARLSPMIEAFLVTHCTEEDEEGSNDGESSVRSAPSTPRVSSPASSIREASSSSDVVGEDKSLDERVAAFVERHRGAINVLLRANPGLLERSFKGVLRHAHAIDFDNKKAYFRSVLRRRSSEAHAGTIRINVRRDRVFDDSYHQLRMRSPNEMKGRLHVQFSGEEGVDAGGVTREWYTILARQIFDPNYVLFTRSAAKAATYQPDKRSYINREHLENFRFVGRIIGKAIYDGQLLDAYFTRSFYKHILGLKPTYHDIEAQDPEYYNSLKWMLENNIDGILDYTMSAEYDEFGKQTVVDLMPNGRNVVVTDENKEDYVRLVTEVRMTRTIEKQIAAFKEGFYELIPKKDCRIFNELELELLMSGLPDIDVADLKANVEYTGYTAGSPQVNWFWRCVSTMDQEDLARLVMFVTGTSKVPLEGFAQLQGMNGVQKFQIHRIGGDSMRLPSAHTCFNQLDLPEYSTADILSERLLRAVRECSVGFGFA